MFPKKLKLSRKLIASHFRGLDFTDWNNIHPLCPHIDRVAFSFAWLPDLPENQCIYPAVKNKKHEFLLIFIPGDPEGNRSGCILLLVWLSQKLIYSEIASLIFLKSEECKCE